MNNKARPLSPHLTIYKPQISSVLSILHRITGVFLFIAILAISWLLIILIMQSIGLAFIGQDLSFILNSIFFKCFLLASVFCLYYHMFNGVRHLVWDAGYGFEIKTMLASGVAVVVLSLSFTAITTYLAIINRF